MARSPSKRSSAVRRKPDRLQTDPETSALVVVRARHLARALLEELKQLEHAGSAQVRRLNPDDDDEDPTRRAGANLR